MQIDQARLRPHLRAGQGKGELPASAALDDVLEAEAELVRRQRGRTAVPSPGSLRGLPVVGSGPGAIAGTNPAAAVAAKERRSQRRQVDALEGRASAAHDSSRRA